MKIFAVFAIVRNGNKLLVTTRPAENKIGLIGGKVDAGESLEVALEREAKEEGALIKVNKIRRIAKVDGKYVAWFDADFVNFLTDYKEKYRGIEAKFMDAADLSDGFGNDFLK